MHDMQGLGAMLNVRQWFVWRLTWDEVAAKYNKVPCYPDGSWPMSAKDSSNWNEHGVARGNLDRLRAGNNPQGVTFALGMWLTNDTGYWFVDIDDCVVNGQLKPIAQELYGLLAGAATEWSSSGRGLHIFGRGTVPAHAKRGPHGTDIEFYTHDRGIAFGLTGQVYGSADTDHTIAITMMVNKYFPYGADADVVPDSAFDTPDPLWRGPKEDVSLIGMMERSVNRSAAAMFGGDATGVVNFADLFSRNVPKLCERWPDDGGGYDESSADAAMIGALAFWTGRDAPRIERIMRQSELFRSKWDENRDDKTYLRYSIDRVLRLHKQAENAVLGQRNATANGGGSVAGNVGTNGQGVERAGTHANGFPFKPNDVAIGQSGMGAMPGQLAGGANGVPQPSTAVISSEVESTKWQAAKQYQDAFNAAATGAEIEAVALNAASDPRMTDDLAYSLGADMHARFKLIGIAKPLAWCRAQCIPQVALTIRQDGFVRTEDDVIERSQTNVTRAVQIWPERVRYDKFTGRIILGAKPFEDTDYTRAILYAESLNVPPPTIGQMRMAVSLVAQENAYDAGQDWLNALQWDGIDRVECSLINLFALDDTLYHRSVARYMWTAMAGRILEPGVKADAVPVFISEEGFNKTSFVEALPPSPEYYGLLSMEGKRDDLSRKIKGKMVMEWGELDGLKTRERTHMLNFITQRHEQWVEKFETMETQYARRMLIIATANDDSFLDAHAKERRMLPIKIERQACDIPMLKLHRDQLWAEARVLFLRNGVEWQAAQMSAAPERDKFRESDPLEIHVGAFIRAKVGPESKFKIAEVVAWLQTEIGMRGRVSQQSIAVILKKSGFHQRSLHGFKIWRKNEFYDFEGD